MLETSKDILFIVLSFCVLWLTVFLCWALYHLIILLKNSNKMVKDANEKFVDWSETVDLVQEKVEDGIQALNLISVSAKTIMSILGDRFKSAVTSRKKKRSKAQDEEAEEE